MASGLTFLMFAILGIYLIGGFWIGSSIYGWVFTQTESLLMSIGASATFIIAYAVAGLTFVSVLLDD